MRQNDDDRPTEIGGFRLNFVLIAALHLLVLGAVLLLAIFSTRKKEENVVWMNPGSFASGSPMSDGAEGGANPDNATGQKENLPPEPEPTLSPQPVIAPSPPTTPEPTPEIPKDTPTPKPSVQVTPTPPPDLVTPKPTPKPTPSSTPKPSPSVTPKPTPKPTAKPPKPTPKPSPKPSTKPAPEESRTPRPKASQSPAHKPPANAKKDEEKLAKNAPSPTAHKSESEGTDKPPKGNSSSSGNGTGSTSGNGEANFGLYAEIIKNRFDGAWNQPHGEIPAGSALVVTVHLKIEPDGAVTEFSIVEGSGNSVVDETVKEAGHKITRLPPPPGGSGFSPTVRFELRND
jgi:colicin import membrane protein